MCQREFGRVETSLVRQLSRRVSTVQTSTLCGWPLHLGGYDVISDWAPCVPFVQFRECVLRGEFSCTNGRHQQLGSNTWLACAGADCDLDRLPLQLQTAFTGLCVFLLVQDATKTTKTAALGKVTTKLSFKIVGPGRVCDADSISLGFILGRCFGH